MRAGRIRSKSGISFLSMAKPKGQIPPCNLEQWIERLQDAGFTVQAQDEGRFRVSQYGCAAVLQASPSGELQFAVRPGLEIRAATVKERSGASEAGEGIAHLLDRGFQKFWQEGKRQIPALSAELQALHRFDQDLRAVLGLTALYNEALGTVSSRYIYDRLEGREKPKRHRAF